MPIASLRNVSRVYSPRRGEPPIRALDDFSIDINQGDYIALLGPNGAGKSTLLRLLAGLEVPQAGDVQTVSRTDLAVVFQRPALDPLLTVRENLSLQAALHGLNDRAGLAQRSAERLGISDRLDSRVGTLSGGLARRADLARALLVEPRLLLLDEPTTGLDHDSRAVFLDAIDGSREASPQLTVIMSTHLMDEAAHATRVALVSKGRLIADDTPEQLRASLGGDHLLRTASENAPVLERYKLSLTTRSHQTTATGEPDAVRAAAEALLSSGAAFELAPPTLADAYTAATGHALTDHTP